MCLFPSLVTGPSFMSISSMVLELWRFSLRDWPEIQKSKIPPSEFYPISGAGGKVRIPNMARMSPIKCYWMLQNARVTAFTVSELLKENQQSGGKITYPTPRLGLMRKKLAIKQYVIWSENLNVVKNLSIIKNEKKFPGEYFQNIKQWLQ